MTPEFRRISTYQIFQYQNCERCYPNHSANTKLWNLALGGRRRMRQLQCRWLTRQGRLKQKRQSSDVQFAFAYTNTFKQGQSDHPRYLPTYRSLTPSLIALKLIATNAIACQLGKPHRVVLRHPVHGDISEWCNRDRRCCNAAVRLRNLRHLAGTWGEVVKGVRKCG